MSLTFSRLPIVILNKVLWLNRCGYQLTTIQLSYHIPLHPYGLGQMPVLSCPNFLGDLYHLRRKCFNTNKYLGRSNDLSNYLHLQIQTPSGVARGQLLPGGAQRGEGGGRQKYFF